jgi:hypothetical protein
VVILAALAACHHPLTPRERALALLPTDASIVGAADGPALAPWRRAVDAARAFVPATFGCVIDAAFASDAIAVAHGEAGTAVVIVSRAAVTGCPALARIADDTYVATIGDAAPEHGLGNAWTRARPYLSHAPIALAADVAHRHWIGEADATTAVMSVDAADAAIVEPLVAASLAPLHPTVSRTGTQVIVRVHDLSPEAVATITGELLAMLDRANAPAPIPLPCPPNGGIVVSCTGGTHLVVSSLPDALTQLTEPAREPVVSGGAIIGLRLSADALMLHRGDVVLGIDAHRVTSAAQLAAVIAVVRAGQHRASVAVRRGTTEIVVDLREPIE